MDKSHLTIDFILTLTMKKPLILVNEMLNKDDIYSWNECAWIPFCLGTTESYINMAHSLEQQQERNYDIDVIADSISCLSYQLVVESILSIE